MLEREVREFLASEPYGADRVTNWEEGYQHVLAVVRREPPETIGSAAGDAVHNMRSALDNLMWQFARRHNDPPADQHLNFPIHTAKSVLKGSSWDKQGIQKMKHVASDVATIVEQFQPFNTDPTEPESAYLWVLNRLWNDDKHQRAAAVGSSTGWMGANLQIHSTRGGFAGPFFLNGPMQNGDVLAGLTFNPQGWHNFATDFTFDLHVALPEDGPSNGAKLPDYLLEIYGFLDEQLLPTFEEL